MKVSSNCIDLIKRFEGCKLTAYKCPAGISTIGWGRIQGVRMGDKCTQLQADKWLIEEVEKKALSVAKMVNNVTQNHFDALVSFAYNVGVGALGRSDLLYKVKANPNDPSIKLEFARWNKAGGKPLLGLTKRRLAEWQLYNS